MSNFVATDVYALFWKSFKKNCNIHVQNEGGGGVKSRLNNVEKTALFTNVGFPNLYATVDQRRDHLPCLHHITKFVILKTFDYFWPGIRMKILSLFGVLRMAGQGMKIN